VNIDDLQKRLGIFLFTFNEIEAQTYEILAILPQDTLVKHCQSIDQFKNRVRFLQALLRSSEIDANNEIEELLEQAIELFGYRNQLAHNPLRVNVLKNENNDVKIQSSILDVKKGKDIPQILEQLNSKTAKAKSIVINLLKLSSR
jgi:hypothetical protein